jgi:hypothetical protein
MSNKVTPIFLFSLPRSGSTLMLKVLSAHEKIASVSEPYLMLPLCYAHRKGGVAAEYSHTITSNGIRNIISNMPNKEEDYFSFMGEFTSRVYASLCHNNETYFLDKTPFYFYAISDIAKVHPDAKFIFLFRNPVQIFASMMTTFNNNRFFKNYRRHNQLELGPGLLAEGYQLLKDKSCMVRYEDFVVNPREQLQKILSYLALDFNEDMLTQYINQDLKGGMGDPTGVKTYSSIIPKSLNKWKSVFNTMSRKKILLNYIYKIPENFFTVSGYNREQIIGEIKSVKGSIGLRNIQDITDYAMCKLIIKTNLHLITSKAYQWSKDVYIN